jgi:SAM-dependent methyltransferase
MLLAATAATLEYSLVSGTAWLASTGHAFFSTRLGERRAAELGAGDYRDLPFADASFDAVVNLFTSFGFYGEEGDAKALAEFRRVLRPNGTLVVEAMHRDPLMAILQAPTWDDLPDGGTRLERREFDHVGGVLAVALTYWPQDGDPDTSITVFASTRPPNSSGWRARPALQRSSSTALPRKVL